MEVMHLRDLPQSLDFDPLIDSYNNLEFLNDIEYENIVDIDDSMMPSMLTETNTYQSNSTLSSDSIINFDVLDDQDINLDLLLNQDLNFDDDFPENSLETNIGTKNYSDKYDTNLRITLKKPRKSKQKSILPCNINDLDECYQTNSKSNLKNEDLIQGKPGERIFLSREEKELLIRDGYTVPTHFPLTKSEERGLKSVRRKIRNKISAKNSRAKKETYVEGLEQRIFVCTNENSLLRSKLAETEQDKRSLFQQVVNLQKQLAKFMPKTSTSSTSLMLLLLTFMVILSPMLDPRKLLMNNYFGNEGDSGKQVFPGRTRRLLQESTEIGEPYMVSIRPGPPWQIPPKTPAVPLKLKVSFSTNIDSRNASSKISKPKSPVKDL